MTFTKHYFLNELLDQSQLKMLLKTTKRDTETLHKKIVRVVCGKRK